MYVRNYTGWRTEWSRIWSINKTFILFTTLYTIHFSKHLTTFRSGWTLELWVQRLLTFSEIRIDHRNHYPIVTNHYLYITMPSVEGRRIGIYRHNSHCHFEVNCSETISNTGLGLRDSLWSRRCELSSPELPAGKSRCRWVPGESWREVRTSVRWGRRSGRPRMLCTQSELSAAPWDTAPSASRTASAYSHLQNS